MSVCSRMKSHHDSQKVKLSKLMGREYQTEREKKTRLVL